MKKLSGSIMISFCMLITATSFSQTQQVRYDFTYNTLAYTNLSGQTTEIWGNNWDNDTASINPPITFKYHGTPVTQWKVLSKGGIAFQNNEKNTLFALFSEYVPKVGSRISYQVSGNQGSRIAKIEYRNMSFQNDTTQYANFQIWLKEGSDKIEYHVGPNQVNASTIDFNQNPNLLIIGLSVDPNAPAMTDTVSVQAINSLGGQNGMPRDTTFFMPTEVDISYLPRLSYGTTYPANGSVFTFTPQQPATSITELPKSEVYLYPNPATDKITLQLKNKPAANATIEICTISGVKVISSRVDALKTEINMTALSNGTYILKYLSGDQKENYQIIKR